MKYRKPQWFVELAGPGGTAPVVYALPHAGAGAAAVKPMCRLLSDVCHPVAVRLPGRESRASEQPITDLADLTSQLAIHVTEHAAGRPVILYGHCAGGAVAFETARRLTLTTPVHLVISAQHAPDRVPVTGAWRMSREAFLEQVARDGYLPTGLLAQPELLDLVEPALRADYEAVESYPRSLATIDTPIMGLLGDDDQTVTVDDITGWQRYTTAGFQLRVLSGGHNLLLDETVQVAAALRQMITG